MTDGKFELSRRGILGATAAIGVAGAGAGVGTSALFSDEESFEDNDIQAGELDLVVDYVTTVTQDGVSTDSTTANGTIQGGESTPYQIADAKPGDEGFLAFCPKIVDNEGWLFVGSDGGVTDYENGQTEPEGDVDQSDGGTLDNGTNDGAGAGELSEAIQVDVEYCEVTSDVDEPSGPEDYTTIREFNNPDDYTLADLLKELESGFLLDGEPVSTSGTQEYPPRRIRARRTARVSVSAGVSRLMSATRFSPTRSTSTSRSRHGSGGTTPIPRIRSPTRRSRRVGLSRAPSAVRAAVT